MKLPFVSRRGTEEAVTGSTRNRLGGSSLPRGFESHPLRQLKTGEKGKGEKAKREGQPAEVSPAVEKAAHGTDLYQQEL